MLVPNNAVVIVVSGGVVQQAFSQDTDRQVILIDWDAISEYYPSDSADDSVDNFVGDTPMIPVFDLDDIGVLDYDDANDGEDANE